MGAATTTDQPTAQNLGAALRLRDPIKPTKPTKQGVRPTTTEQPTARNFGAALRLRDPIKPTKPTKPTNCSSRNVATHVQWRQSAQPLVVYGPYTTRTQISKAVRT